MNFHQHSTTTDSTSSKPEFGMGSSMGGSMENLDMDLLHYNDRDENHR